MADQTAELRARLLRHVKLASKWSDPIVSLELSEAESLLDALDQLKAERDTAEGCARALSKQIAKTRVAALQDAKRECCAIAVMLGGRYQPGADKCLSAMDELLATARAALEGNDDE